MKTTNIIGDSLYQHNITILFAVVPDTQAAAPTFLNRSGGNNTIGLTPFVHVSWLPPVDDGASAILGYKLEMQNLNTSSGWYTVYDGRA